MQGRWSSGAGVALIGAAGIVVAALIGGAFSLVPTLLSPQIAIAGPVTSEFLGKGLASLSAPDSMGLEQTLLVTLSVSLGEELDPDENEFVHEDLDEPAVSVEPGSGDAPATRRQEYRNLPIYTRMCAQLDAPGFTYTELDCSQDLSNGSGEWTWIGRPNSTGRQQIVVRVSAISPDGTIGVSWPALITTVDVSSGAPTPTPDATPSPTPSPTPTLVVTPTPTPTATATPTPTPSPAPTATPTPSAGALLEAEAGIGDGIENPRSDASGSATVRLRDGETQQLNGFVAGGTYALQVRYANDNVGDGPLEGVLVVLGDEIVLPFLAEDTGNAGAGWNCFNTAYLGDVTLPTGPFTIELQVAGGDDLGMEIDYLELAETPSPSDACSASP